MITAMFRTGAIHATSQDAFMLHERSSWGEKKQNYIEYSLVETLVLLKAHKMKLYQGTKEITELEFLKKAKKIDKRIETKAAVYADLKKKGYTIKTALKFGAEFRVYDKGAKPGIQHARWLLFPVKENEMLTWYDFAAKNRVATSTNKHLLLAIVDEENDVTYYEIAWMRP